MKPDVSQLRLHRQLISRPQEATPPTIVSWFGAIQAQDYLAALWALGLRTAKADGATIETAVADGSIIRTHAFRYTWQFIAREDVRWVLGLMGERINAAAGPRYRRLELDQKTLKRCGELFARALGGGNHLTRAEMAAVLAKGRIPAVNLRLLHILGHAELDGVICSGTRRGKHATFALLEERVPAASALSRDEALQRLALRYFQSRGPASDRDFSWWTGLNLTEARRAILAAGHSLRSEVVQGRTLWQTEDDTRARRSTAAYLLPAFDEYQVAYQNRSDVLRPEHLRKMNAGGGLLKPAVVVDGQIVGSWRRELGSSGVRIRVTLFQRITAAQRQAVREAAGRYAGFLGLDPDITMR